MAVLTTINFDELNLWLMQYSLDKLLDFQGISAGVTNTNYLVTTESEKYILTIFENTSIDELPFYIELMAFLSGEGVACPQPILNNQKKYLSLLKNKPALIVPFINGSEVTSVHSEHCFEVGKALANLHLKAQNYRITKKNSRDIDWIKKTFLELSQKISAENYQIITEECTFLDEYTKDNLAEGIIHADLFKDNVLINNGRVSGMIDLYYACTDKYIYDLSITINDWCIDNKGEIESEKLKHFIDGYESIRKLEAKEMDALPIYLRLAALRFWLSRLYDFYNIREGEKIITKDPNHFKNILLKRQRSQ